MKRIGILTSLALAITVAMACNNRTDTAVRDDAAGSAIGTTGTTVDRVSAGDKAFVDDLTIANMAEVELGKMALEHSKNTSVKSFAQMMVDDHTKAGEKLSAVATEYSIPMPTELDATHRDLRDKLAKLQGPAFDREYMDAMAHGHETVLDKLEARIDKDNLADWKTRMNDRLHGKGPEAAGEPIAIMPEKSDNVVTTAVNQWAADSYPVVHRHLDRANAIHDALTKATRSTQ
jgi:putative membrane protein